MDRTRPCPRRAAAFTLTEVLVVLGIIAVLLSLLFPVISSVRAAAARVACAANLRQIGTVIHAYAVDNRGQLPVLYGGPEGGPQRPSATLNAVANDRGGMKLLVSPPIGTAGEAYLRSAKIFLCDAWLSTSGYEQWGGNPDEFAYFPGWGPMPAEAGHRVMSYHYCYVPPGGDWYQQGAYVGGPGPHWKPGLLAGFERYSLSVRRPSSTTLMFESSVFTLGGLPGVEQQHGYLGHVLYLDGHVMATDAREVNRYVETHGTPPSSPAGPAEIGNAKALLRALDEGVGAR